MIRDLTEGFGDGGFFAEGDGTGSMSSHIVYLGALLGRRNAVGLDLINVERPNARMTALKWIYGTVFRGAPGFRPIRGTCGQKVWSRRGLSGGGCLAYGFAAVTDEQKAALKWYYNHFMREVEAKAGTPFDTASAYPRVAVGKQKVSVKDGNLVFEVTGR